MEFDTTTVEKAVQQFYYNGTGQPEVHQWLTLAQVSPKAWNFCWDLMQLDKPPEIQFFGANCLYVKISKFWAELPPEQYVELQQKLLHYIVLYSNGGPHIVLTRLFVALSNFILHTIPSNWTSAITDLMGTLHPANLPQLPPDRVIIVLLEFLTVLPEEFQSVTLAQSFRAVVRQQLQANSSTVLHHLHQTLIQNGNTSIRLQALRCLMNWITYAELPDSGELLSVVFSCVHDRELGESSVEVLMNVVINPEVHKYRETLLRLLHHLLNLESVLNVAKENEDQEMCNALYSLYLSFGECHSRMILEESLSSAETKNNVIKLVQLILECSGFPGQYPVDETSSNLPFSFWYTFQDDVMSLDPHQVKSLISVFGPVYTTLVDILLRKVRYPNLNDFNTWNSDEKEQLRCYREDIGDTLIYCFNLLHEQLLEHLLSNLENVLTMSCSDEEREKSLEACLFAFQAIAENVDPDDMRYVPKLFAIIPTLPYNNNTRVISTALDAIGAFAEWINQHPGLLPNIIPLLVTGLNDSSTAQSATVALRDITRDCQKSMKPFAPEILTACHNALKKGNLKSHEQTRLMFTIGRVSSVLEYEHIMPFLNELLTPYITQLEQLSEVEELTPPAQAQLILRLSMLSILFLTLDTKRPPEREDDDNGKRPSSPVVETAQPMLLVLERILPVLRMIAVKWNESLPVVQGIGELLKKAVTTLLDESFPAAAGMLDLTVFLFQARPNAIAFNMLKQCILLFGKDEVQKQHLKHAFLTMSNVTLDIGQKGSISDHADIVEEFLQLLAQIVKKKPHFLLDEDYNLSALFVFAIFALSVPEAPTVKAAASFLVGFIIQSRETEQLTNVVNGSGEALLNQTLRCIGGESPRGVMDSMADILLALNKKYFDNMCRWMNTILNRENFPSPNVTREQKEHFIRLVLKERSNKRKLQETVKEFTLICRGLIGTEYGVQVLPSL